MNRTLSRNLRSAPQVLFLLVLSAVTVAAELPNPATGVVKFFVDAKSDFDPWTSNPTSAQQAFMREHYYRMQTYSPYFDSRLSWYPGAWEYKDSYAIKPGWPVFDEHPEWILRDAAGNMLYIPYACSGGTCPQFAADVGNPEFRAWWIADARAKIELGYGGLWVDDVNFEWRIGNGAGDSVRPIDPRTGKQMTLADWRRYFADFMEELRDEFPDIEIAHNVNWAAEPTDDPSILRQIDAADYINLERGISDSGITAGTGKYGFETFLALVDRVHARGRNVIIDDDDDDSVQDRDYDLAFYFLINDGGDLLSADGDRSRMNPDNFWAGYQTDLGMALGDRYRWNGLFRRDFSCGVVLVNQPQQSTVTVDLGAEFTALNGGLVETVQLPAASGAVLRSACLDSKTPMPPRKLQILE
jgi:Hypothetical glycosyl hydrolase family 15